MKPFLSLLCGITIGCVSTTTTNPNGSTTTTKQADPKVMQELSGIAHTALEAELQRQAAKNK